MPALMNVSVLDGAAAPERRQKKSFMFSKVPKYSAAAGRLRASVAEKPWNGPLAAQPAAGWRAIPSHTPPSALGAREGGTIRQLTDFWFEYSPLVILMCCIERAPNC
jgi:hypothetical protein